MAAPAKDPIVEIGETSPTAIQGQFTSDPVLQLDKAKRRPHIRLTPKRTISTRRTQVADSLTQVLDQIGSPTLAHLCRVDPKNQQHRLELYQSL
ncbi:hypothetical protein LIER_36224 [Lithospermum erythrorhizon]|uniref:Uncharacterized protein n=1 Tax=Lithospermum erythrorhizon TaxID=34254 RepID=A0AAV3P389_LITER